MSLKKLGELLRQERISKGLGLDEVKAKTKLGHRHIEALEDGRIEDLPHPVYAKGFYKTYASVLGLDPAKLVENFDGLFPSEDEGKGDFVNPDQLPSVSGSRRVFTDSKKGGKFFFLLIVLLLLAGGGWYAWNSFFKGGPGEANKTETQESQIVQPGEVEGAAPVVPVPEAEPVETAARPDLDLNMTGNATEAMPVEPQDNATVGGEDGRELLVVESNQPELTHVVEIIPDELCWIGIRADDVKTHHEVGEEHIVVVRFNSTAVITLGNADGVRLRYDGRDFEAPEGEGNVATIVFPPKP